MVAVSHTFLQEAPSKLEIQYKKAVCFSFNFGWYSIQLEVFHFTDKIC